MGRMLNFRALSTRKICREDGPHPGAFDSGFLRSSTIRVDQKSGGSSGARRPLLISSRELSRAKTEKNANPFTSHALSLGSELFQDDNAFVVDHSQLGLGSVNWERHRHQWRHLSSILSLFTSRLLGSPLPPIVYLMTLFATFVVLWNYSVVFKLAPSFFPLLRLSAFPFMISLTLVSFLLTFRTNASYGRFEEVSKLCTSIVVRIRDISRFALTSMSNKGLKAKKILNILLRHLQAFPFIYKHEFLKIGSLERELRTHTTLTQNEIDNIMQASHKPNYVVHMISECIQCSDVHPMQKNFMDSLVTGLLDGIGGSERIYQTPVPVYYTRLTSQILVIWHFFLPLALWDVCQWGTILVFFLIATLLFRIEEVGILIEQPFSLFPLDEIARSVNTNISEMISQHETARASVESSVNSLEACDPYNVSTFMRNLTPGILLLLKVSFNPEPETVGWTDKLEPGSRPSQVNPLPKPDQSILRI